jgi:hypothetical protein
MTLKSDKRTTFFTKTKLNSLQKFFVKLKQLQSVRSANLMRRFLFSLKTEELNLLSECVYNVIYNTEVLYDKNFVLFVQYLFVKSDYRVRKNLYYFVFSNLSRKEKIDACVKSYYFVVFSMIFLLPVLKLFLENSRKLKD